MKARLTGVRDIIKGVMERESVRNDADAAKELHRAVELTHDLGYFRRGTASGSTSSSQQQPEDQPEQHEQQQ
ncbi:hypothetical protein A2U01_0101775 [Trifolium medium]|uniref:Uncharacterized protein n=1 Tax=Trifolium medium TaxID=97028 RepID=A0A392UWU1_9FABA|nr:hypothetical protein [Trifolium medium]